VIVEYAEADVPPALKLQVARLQRQAWPEDGPPTANPVHDPALRPLSMLLLEDDRVLTALDVLSKTVEHDRRPFAASGLSTVVTDEARRREGHGLRLVEAARRRIGELGADVALFTCDRPLQGFYEAAGFELLPGTVLVGGTQADPLRSDAFDKVTLGCFYAPDARALVGGEILLHPGEIDRLW
jgi:GNAT superfamily N-acetyltransferase